MPIALFILCIVHRLMGQHPGQLGRSRNWLSLPFLIYHVDTNNRRMTAKLR